MAGPVPKQSQQSQQLEGKRSKWKLFGRARNSSTEALSEPSPTQKNPNLQPVDPRTSIATQSSATTDGSRTSAKDSCDKNSATSHAVDSRRQVSPATTGPLNNASVVAPDLCQHGRQMYTNPTTACSSTNPPIKQETYVDPVTGVTTTRTTITTVVTTVVNKPLSPISPTNHDLDFEEERRLASEFLAVREMVDSGKRGLQPAPKTGDRESKRFADAQSVPAGGRGQTHVDSVRSQQQVPVSNGHGPAPHGQPERKYEDPISQTSDHFGVVSNLGEIRRKVRLAYSQSQGRTAWLTTGSQPHMPTGKKIALQSTFTDPPASEKPPTRGGADYASASHSQTGPSSVEKSTTSSFEKSRHLPGIYENKSGEDLAQNGDVKSKPNRLSIHSRVREPSVVFPPTPPIELHEKRDYALQRGGESTRIYLKDQEDLDDTPSKPRTSGTFGADAMNRGGSRPLNRNSLSAGVHPLASHPVSGPTKF